MGFPDHVIQNPLELVCGGVGKVWIWQLEKPWDALNQAWWKIHSSTEQNADGNVDSAREVSFRSKDCTAGGLEATCYALEKNLHTFCPCPETLEETEIRGSRLIHWQKKFEAAEYSGTCGCFQPGLHENQKKPIWKIWSFARKEVLAVLGAKKSTVVEKMINFEKRQLASEQYERCLEVISEISKTPAFADSEAQNYKAFIEKRSLKLSAQERSAAIGFTVLRQDTRSPLQPFPKWVSYYLSWWRPWHHPWGAGFMGMQNSRVPGSERLPARFLPEIVCLWNSSAWRCEWN